MKGHKILDLLARRILNRVLTDDEAAPYVGASLVEVTDKDYFYEAEGTNWCFGKEDMSQKLDSAVELLNAYPPKKADKRIAFLVDSYYIGEHSGIFTFIRHFNTMAEELGFHLDLISEIVFDIPHHWDTSNVSFFFMPHFSGEWGKEMYCAMEEQAVRSQTMQLAFEDYLNEYLPSLVVSHSYSATKVLVEKQDELDSRNIPYMAYTHIGDIMDPDNTDILDFTDEVVRDFISLLSDHDIPIGTQTASSKRALKTVLRRDGISILPEPFYTPEMTYRTVNGTKGVIIVSSNYKRKNFDKMFEALAITGLPVTVVCGSDVNPENGKTLKQMAMEAGVQQFRIMRNVPNRYITSIISSHRVMLHLSDIEVMPYALLEGSVHIPCIINGVAPWSQDIPVPHIPVDPNDLMEVVTRLNETYGDTYEYLGLDADEYGKDCLKIWKGVLNVD